MRASTFFAGFMALVYATIAGAAVEAPGKPDLARG